MALKDKWTDKVNGESDILAEDINNIANELIETQEDTYAKTEVDTKLSKLSDSINSVGFDLTRETSDRKNADDDLSNKITIHDLDIYNVKNSLTEVQSGLADTDTKDINNELANASKVLARKTVSLNGDILTDKTTDNLYLLRATPEDKAVFGETLSLKSQYMGHIGIQGTAKSGLTKGARYYLIADIEIGSSDMFDLSVNGMYRASGSTQDSDEENGAVGTIHVTSASIESGVATHVYVIYPFANNKDYSIQGFYMQAPKVVNAEIRLNNVYLCQGKSIYTNKDKYSVGIYDTSDGKSKTVLYQGNTIINYAQVTKDILVKVNASNNIYAVSLGSAIEDKSYIVYESLKDTYTLKSEFSSFVNSKGIEFSYNSTTLTLENGCMYYIRSNSSSKDLWILSNDSVVTDTDGKTVDSFKEAMIITSNNLFEEAVYQHIIFMPSTLSLTSKAFQITPGSNLQVGFVTGASGTFSVWKMKV